MLFVQELLVLCLEEEIGTQVERLVKVLAKSLDLLARAHVLHVVNRHEDVFLGQSGRFIILFCPILAVFVDGLGWTTIRDSLLSRLFHLHYQIYFLLFRWWVAIMTILFD